MRPVIASTAARVLGLRHPKSVTKIKAIRTLYSGVTHLPTKHQKLLNQLGDTYSKKTSLRMMDAACEGHDKPILDIKRDVESLWLGKMADATPRDRQRMAKKLGITGAAPFGDNLGIVSTEYTVQSTVYSVQCTLYTVQCTVYSVQCSVCIRLDVKLHKHPPENCPPVQRRRAQCQQVPSADKHHLEEKPSSVSTSQVFLMLSFNS